MKRARWEIVLIVLGVIMYLLEFPHGIHGDGTVRYDALRHLLASGKFDPILYSFVQPLVSAPLLLLGYVFKDGFWWMSRFNAFLFLGTAFYTARRLRQSLSAEASRTYLLLLFCGTMFPAHVTDYYSEVFGACCIALAIFEFQAGRSFTACALTCLTVWNSPGTALAGTALLAFFACRRRQFRYFFVVPLLALGIIGENYLKFGVATPATYLGATGAPSFLPYAAGPGFTYPFFFGLLSVFFSFGKGLIFFVPGLLGAFCASVWRGADRLREFIHAGAVYLLGLVLVYARWWCWSGAYFWGPRFYLFASILGVMLLMVLWQERARLSAAWRVFWFFAAGLSCWVGCEGVLYGQDFLEDCYGQDPRLAPLCYYIPEFSPLWRVFVIQPLPHGRKMAYLVYFALVAGTLLWFPGKRLLSELGQFMRGLYTSLGPRAGWRP